MDASGKYELQEIRKFSREMLYWVYNMLIPEECQLPVSFWLQYNEEQQTIGLHASLLLWVHTKYQDLPREFQLTATIATISGQDSRIDVGTGAGKTLCMVLPCLLTPEHMAIITSPLKWLQAVTNGPEVQYENEVNSYYMVMTTIFLAQAAVRSPSSLARSQGYVELQRDSRERILDDRPEPDYEIPPIPLLYSGFGHFLDIMDGRDDVPGLAAIKVAELRMAVDTLATEMTRFFEKESQRRDKGPENLHAIFAAREGTQIPKISASAIGSVMSDGHDVADNGTSSIVVEFKNLPTAVPQAQVVGNVAHLDAALSKEAYLQWRVPCLSLTIVGCDITFYAVLAVDHRIRLVSLTPTLCCVRSASDGRDRKSLYLVFAAASVLQVQILEDVQKLIDDRKLLKDPAVAEIPYATSHGFDDYLTFEICGLLDDRIHDCFLYKAKRPGADELILIKFVQRYLIDLHHFCAKAGHAPSILGYERLPGGWFSVAMEYVKPDISITESTH
ncbi:hypothetical protein EDB87DRAFT_1836674 [Lactarius vividus]|nr:hypothetical protein EDB87DRAFT_1836674 [Lactarius vividus]